MRKAACKSAMEDVFASCDARHREQLTLDGAVGCVFERCASHDAAATSCCLCITCRAAAVIVQPVMTAPAPAACSSPYCHAVIRKNVCAVFAGEIAGQQAEGQGGRAASAQHPWAAFQSVSLP